MVIMMMRTIIKYHYYYNDEEDYQHHNPNDCSSNFDHDHGESAINLSNAIKFVQTRAGRHHIPCLIN